jgi:uncharacterized membrane protein YgdD (TMEM256/DUF423 family)
VRWILFLFSGGVLLFSGSIYVLSTRELTGWEAAGSVVGPITPLGGLMLMTGWLLLFLPARHRSHPA